MIAVEMLNNTCLFFCNRTELAFDKENDELEISKVPLTFIVICFFLIDEKEFSTKTNTNFFFLY